MVILLIIIFDAAVQELVITFIVSVIEKKLGKYLLLYTYVRYPRIILGQKYDLSFPYVPIFGLTKIFYFPTCIRPDLGKFHVKPV